MTDRYVLSVSPDFPPKGIPGWYIFNTWLQKKLDTRVHLELFDSFDDQRSAIARSELDLIYANPFDASVLIREQGFTAIAAPMNKPDETLITVNIESSYVCVEDLPEKISVACTDEPEVNLIGNILLEPADIERQNISFKMANSYVLVAKAVLNNQADVGYFLKGAYDEFTNIIKSQLRVLISSEIQIIRHVMLAGPNFCDRSENLVNALMTMRDDDKGAGVLQSMDLQGWEPLSQEDAEFMIDLMDTLQS